MKITELFDRPVKLNWQKRPGGSIRTTVDLNGRTLSIDFYLDDAKLDMWTVEFDVDGQVKQTGGGGSTEIFSIFMQALNTWLNSQGPDWVWWSASLSEPSRVRLYKRLPSRVSADYVNVSQNTAAWPKPLQELVASDRGRNDYTVLMRRGTQTPHTPGDDHENK